MEPGGNAAGDRGWLRRILQEPLFQFVLIGLAVFALFGLRNEPGPSAPDVSEIVITQSCLLYTSDAADELT